MNSDRPVVRIAHAYGNRRATLSEALAADVDMIEADVWFRGGRGEVRHEHRLGWLPLLAGRRPHGMSVLGPRALSLPMRSHLRVDAQPLHLGEMLRAVAGSKRILLDIKPVRAGQVAGLAYALERDVRATGCEARVAVCGRSWLVLDRLRESAPELEVRYSIGGASQWDDFRRRLERGEGPPRVCVWQRLLDEERTAFLAKSGIDVYCWTVDDAVEARRLVERGVDGIISNDLGLLVDLG